MMVSPAAESGFHVECGFAEVQRAAIVALLREYEAGLGISLCFQDFEAELAGLPGAYAPPGGQMMLLRDSSSEALMGCVAVRPVAGIADLCEMKRLYVRPGARGGGLGRRLALSAIEEARRLGYSRISLDTLPTMTEARALYISLGFRQVGTTTSSPPVVLFERGIAV